MQQVPPISVCGTDCAACDFFGKPCEGCHACQGQVFFCNEGEACAIYRCVREKKGMQDCRACGEAPCAIWQQTRDPAFTDEGFAENIRQRLLGLQKAGKDNNRLLADVVLGLLAPLGEVRRIAMMGGYIFYYRERIIGGIYGNGFLVKDVPAAREAMPNARIEPPYDGAKNMLHVTCLGDGEKLRNMVREMWPQLPERTGKKKSSRKSER